MLLVEIRVRALLISFVVKEVATLIFQQTFLPQEYYLTSFTIGEMLQEICFSWQECYQSYTTE